MNGIEKSGSLDVLKDDDLAKKKVFVHAQDF